MKWKWFIIYVETEGARMKAFRCRTKKGSISDVKNFIRVNNWIPIAITKVVKDYRKR